MQGRAWQGPEDSPLAAARVVEIVDPDHWNGLLFRRGDYDLPQSWECSPHISRLLSQISGLLPQYP